MSVVPKQETIAAIATNASLLESDLRRLKELLESIANRAEALYKAADAARTELG